MTPQTTLDLLNLPEITIERDGANHVLRYDMKGWGADITAEYWQTEWPKDLPDRVSHDGWAYRVPAISDHRGGTYSHPTMQGCQIMILKHLVDCGVIQSQETNAHRDERNTEIAAEIESAWTAHTDRPRVGDFVKMPNGSLRRCSHGWDDGMQTSDGGSYSIGKSGRASMSGSLYPSQLWEFFHDTGETKLGRFWFFSHNRPGAGRGVDVYLPCRVYELRPFAMTEEQARERPEAKRAAEFWGENDRGHLEIVGKLMNPAALTGGYY